MFYICEIVSRCKYIFFSIFLLLLICFLEKNVLMFLLTESIQSFNNDIIVNKVDHFIYTHPTELFTVQLFIVVYSSTALVLPYIAWQVVDFLKPSLFEYECMLIKKTLTITTILIYIFNLLGLFYLFPNIWFFFENFNSSLVSSQANTFFLELRVYEYYCFMASFLKVMNLSILFLISLTALFLFYGLKDFLHWKKLFIFLNMVFATLLSPPDIYSQLAIFFFLVFIFEFLISVLIILHKIQKFTFINMATY